MSATNTTTTQTGRKKQVSLFGAMSETIKVTSNTISITALALNALAENGAINAEMATLRALNDINIDLGLNEEGKNPTKEELQMQKSDFINSMRQNATYR